MKNMPPQKSVLMKLMLIACSWICLASCYRMPTENDFSVVPTTNNPAVTCEKNDSLLPGVGY
jgi:hypothetical protein